MKLLLTLAIVGFATALLLTANSVMVHLPLTVHSNAFINHLARYQLFALAVGALVTVLVLRLTPESRQFLRVGDLDRLAMKEKWLGISGATSWRVNGAQLLLFVSLATGLFMFLAVQATGNLSRFQTGFIPYILLFSLTNALAEELIFRFGVLGGLFRNQARPTVLLMSAVLFGLPHYGGFPSGPVGVLMAAVLGYILGKATLETKGLGVAWGIHVVQDVLIFTGLLMMNVGDPL